MTRWQRVYIIVTLLIGMLTVVRSGGARALADSLAI